MYEIQISEYLLIIFKKIKLIIIIITLFTLISLLLSFFVIEPVYQASTTIMIGNPLVNNSEIEYSDFLINDKLIETYREIAISKVVTNEVINNLNLNISHNQIIEKVNISLINDTEIIKIEVNYTDPLIAISIAQEFSEVFIKYIKTIFKLDNVLIIDKAEVPKEPIKPDIFLNVLISVFSAIIISIFLIVVLELFDNRIKKPLDIEKNTNLSVLGNIPKEFKKNKKIKNEDKEIKWIDEKQNGLIAESYKTLRTNIQFLNNNNNLNTLMFSSYRVDEGKSEVVCNLALSMTKIYDRVLLIDCNLRKPIVHKFFKLINDVGLTNFLNDEEGNNGVVYSLGVGYPDIITAGPIQSNPTELLSSNKIIGLLAQLEINYDIILIDAPPIGLVSDPIIISTMVDGVILVCSTENAKTNELKETIKLFNNVKANVVGTILNKTVIDKKMYNSYQLYK